ncbi:MAG: cytochrome c biogenesis protein CcsA [Phycisphaerales bacterium]
MKPRCMSVPCTVPRIDDAGWAGGCGPLGAGIARAMTRRAGTWHAAVAAIVFVLALAMPSRAQTAPDGNAHPTSQAVTQLGEMPNPFGDPQVLREAPADKAAFARAVDLKPLETLAVFHDGRVKIIDTLARETVLRIVGRRAYQDPVTEPVAGVETGAASKLKLVSFPPLFTFLDLMIDPAWYISKPLVHVEYLPLRREVIEASLPATTAETPEQKAARLSEQERWSKLTRLSPAMLMRHLPAVQTRHEFEPAYRRSFGELGEALSLFESGAANLMMVAPARPSDPYQHLSTLPADSPARKAALELGAAWRARDAARVNAAVKTLAVELPKINAPLYPTSRRTVEHAYNRVNAFEWGYWAYLLSLVSLILAFGTARRWLVAMGITMLSIAVALHAFGFVTRCIIAERFAIQNQFESMTGLSLFAAAVGLAIMIARRQWLFGAAVAGVGFMVLLTATQAPIPGRFIEREAAILNTSVLLKYHVTTVLTSYGLISLGFVVSLFYLGTHYLSRSGARAAAGAVAGSGSVALSMGGPPISRRNAELAAEALNLGADAPRGVSRTLSDLDKAQMTILQLAFWTLGVGILLGAWWADHSWGRWWAFDPKETWALVTWIIYLIVVHVRMVSGMNRGLVTAWLSVVGFIVMLWTYFGVNLILPGLHAYA